MSADGGAELRFASVVATCDAVRLSGSTIRAGFECKGSIEALGERSPVSYLSMNCRRLSADRIVGSTTFSLYDDARTIIGRVPALTSFTRVR